MLFSTDNFKCQLAIKAIKMYMNRRHGIGIKLHPNKKKLRELMWNYAYGKKLGYSHMYLYAYLLEWLDIYFNYEYNYDYNYNLQTKIKQVITQQLNCQIQRNTHHIECPICLDTLISNTNTNTNTNTNIICDDVDNPTNIQTQHYKCYVSDLIMCKGPSNHIYHIKCYVEFLKSEEQKDISKTYKCEYDTLCVVCYQPMYL